MTGQNWLAAEFGPICRNSASALKGMSRTGLMARFGAGKKCCLLVKEPVWVLDFCSFQKFLTKGSSRREKGRSSGCPILNDSLESCNRESGEKFL